MTTEEEISAARERGPRRFRAGSQIAISPRFLTSPIRSDPIDGRINRGRATESSSSTTWPIRSRSIGRINCVPIDRFASWINYDSPVLPSSPSDTGFVTLSKIGRRCKIHGRWVLHRRRFFPESISLTCYRVLPRKLVFPNFCSFILHGGSILLPSTTRNNNQASFEAPSYDFPGGLPFRSISIELRWFPVNYEIKIAKDSEKSRPRFTRPSISLIFVRINCSLRYICC